MDKYTDDEILHGLRTRRRDVAAFVCAQYFESIRYLVLSKGGSEEQAKDNFQSGLEDLLVLIDRDGFTLTCNIRTLLYKMCENRWKNQLERFNIEKRYALRKLEEDDVPDHSENLDQDLFDRIVRFHFRQLAKGCIEILKLFLSGRSPAEIAEQMNTTPDYIKKRKSNCKDMLVTAIQNDPKFNELKKSNLKWPDTLNIS